MNTTEPCAKCKWITWNPLTEDDPLEKAFCVLHPDKDVTISQKDCVDYDHAFRCEYLGRSFISKGGQSQGVEAKGD